MRSKNTSALVKVQKLISIRLNTLSKEIKKLQRREEIKKLQRRVKGTTFVDDSISANDQFWGIPAWRSPYSLSWDLFVGTKIENEFLERILFSKNSAKVLQKLSVTHVPYLIFYILKNMESERLWDTWENHPRSLNNSPT